MVAAYPNQKIHVVWDNAPHASIEETVGAMAELCVPERYLDGYVVLHTEVRCPAVRQARTALLERDDQLRQLRVAVDEARRGEGRLVLVLGEAGIGKTTLLDEFAEQIEGAARVFLGACEGLLTPRALAPFRDMARDCAALGGLRTVDEFVDALLDQMSIGARPAVVIVEDAHWADDASLDVIRCLGRRVGRLPALLVVSFRDEELDTDHPLRRVVGALVGSRVLHLELPELSEMAVRRLAASAGIDGDAVVAAAGGNPFFVTEVLAVPGEMVPPSVRHAVLARMCALPRECRSALEQLAVVPAEVVDWLVTALVPDRTVLVPAERLGMIVVGHGMVRFRHELARRAVEGAIPGSVQVRLHARVLRALVAVDVDASSVVRHAAAADAARLHVSRRTVDNHVSALFERLGVRSRRAAAARAADLGLLPVGEHES